MAADDVPPGDVAPGDQLGQRLRSEGRRLGHARRQVLQVVEAAGAPVSVEDVAARLPDVHVSSVYRSLNVLEELGLVSHTHLAHGAALYEIGSAAPKVHLVCEVCGRDVAVPTELFDLVRDRVAQEYDFVISAHHFAVVGRCTTCTEPDRQG